MNKKILFSTLLMFGLILPSYAADTEKPLNPPPHKMQNFEQPNMNFERPPLSKEEMEKKKEAFEKRLKLTDEQKLKAKELRERGREEMKPIFDAIKAKHEELTAIRNSKGSKEEAQKIRNELQELHKKAHEQKMKNMKEFEAILSKKQLKELEKMKEEGRKKFEQAHKNCKCGKDCKCGHEHIRPVMPPPTPETK